MRTVPLHGMKAAGRVALVDDEDYDLVMQHRWNVSESVRNGYQSGPYAFTSTGSKKAGKRSIVLMHNLILGIKGVDHANHNGLDNRRSNLRPATATENMGNKRGKRNGSSQYKGVWWNKRGRCWVAEIVKGQRKRWLGSFASEVDAARAYDAAARAVFGEFACVNFPAICTPPLDGLVDQAGRLLASHAPESRTCVICGSQYVCRINRVSYYCGPRCSAKADRRRKKERELDGRLF